MLEYFGVLATYNYWDTLAHLIYSHDRSSYRKQLHKNRQLHESAGNSIRQLQEIAYGSYMNSAVTGKMAHVLRAVKAVCTCSRGEIK